MYFSFRFSDEKQQHENNESMEHQIEKRKRAKRRKVKDNGDAVRKSRRKRRTSKGASVSKVYSLEESHVTSLIDLIPIFLSISRGTENEKGSRVSLSTYVTEN